MGSRRQISARSCQTTDIEQKNTYFITLSQNVNTADKAAEISGTKTLNTYVSWRRNDWLALRFQQ